MAHRGLLRFNIKKAVLAGEISIEQLMELNEEQMHLLKREYVDIKGEVEAYIRKNLSQQTAAIPFNKKENFVLAQKQVLFFSPLTAANQVIQEEPTNAESHRFKNIRTNILSTLISLK